MARRKYWYPKKTVNHLVRRWLNPMQYVRGYGSQGGFIVTQLKVRRGQQYGSSVHLRIADCNRSIDLDLEADNPQDRNRAVRKLSILIDEIRVLRHKLEAMEFERK